MRAALNINSCITVLMRLRLRLDAWRTGASGSLKVFCPIRRNKFIATVAIRAYQRARSPTQCPCPCQPLVQRQ